MDVKTPGQMLWYFAYGANMSPDILTKQRKVYPKEQALATLSDYALAFNVPGVPYSEPAMAGLARMPQNENARTTPCVHGIAYLISSEDFVKILATEGAGVAYTSLRTSAKPIDSEKGERDLQVYTLVARRPATRPERRPSARYLKLLSSAAKDNSFPTAYQSWLASQSTFQARKNSRRDELGLWLFQGLWFRVQKYIQMGIVRFRDEKGFVPVWFLWVFDSLIILMWLQHDYMHRFIFGRGDGL